jgi:hypothetical protein
MAGYTVKFTFMAKDYVLYEVQTDVLNTICIEVSLQTAEVYFPSSYQPFTFLLFL